MDAKKRARTITKELLALIGIGIAVNLIGAKLALALKLPLFLDCIGTVLTAAVGGYLPGIVVGFVTNLINGLSDPITLYYGTLNVLIAFVTAVLAKRRWFSTVSHTILAGLLLAAIGGGLGSVVTWLLYGFNFGSGISAPFAQSLYAMGLPQFWAQFLADMGIDLADKLITVLAVFALLRRLPGTLFEQFAFSPLRSMPQKSGETGRTYKHSLRQKILLSVIMMAVSLGILATVLSHMLYRDSMIAKYADLATGAAKIAAQAVDGDRVNDYLSTGVKDPAYLRTEQDLETIRASIPDIEFVYVYQIDETACHVVFDLDTPELPAGELGEEIPIEEAFQEYREAFLQGEDIPPVTSNDTYGWLLSAYIPISDSGGNCVAYAAVDMSMNEITTDSYIFIIKVISLFFGASIVIVAIAITLAETCLIEPINAITAAASQYANDEKSMRLDNEKKIRSLNIQTDDEIENLYHALVKTAADITQYIQTLNEDAKTISQMQQNVILTFANLVENRDENTGDHIRNTARYVHLIARELQKEGLYPEKINDQYIQELERSAPLHDIGKIIVPDAILNKPGKLTPEEFEIMKRHTTAGGRILRAAAGDLDKADNYLTCATEMALYHHERWDGNGYAAGLKGLQIPLSARIMAVADVYDALRSKRSYKEPMSRQEAMEIIRGEAGTHFEPLLTEVFDRALGENSGETDSEDN